MFNYYVIGRKIDELIRQQKITNEYPNELAERCIQKSTVNPEYWKNKLQNEVYRQ